MTRHRLSLLAGAKRAFSFETNGLHFISSCPRQRYSTKAVSRDCNATRTISPSFPRLGTDCFATKQSVTHNDLLFPQLQHIRGEIGNLTHPDAKLKMPDMKRNFMNQDWDTDGYIEMMEENAPFLMAVLQQGFQFDSLHSMLAIQALVYRKDRLYMPSASLDCILEWLTVSFFVALLGFQRFCIAFLFIIIFPVMPIRCFQGPQPVRSWLGYFLFLLLPSTQHSPFTPTGTMISRTALNKLFDDLLGKSELGLDKSKRQEMVGTWVRNTVTQVKKAEEKAGGPLVWAFGQDNLNFWVRCGWNGHDV